MAISLSRVGSNDQNGYAGADNIYHEAAGSANLSMAVGQSILYRFPTYIPVGATVTAATLKLPYGVKFQDQASTSTNVVRIHAHHNAPMLIEGANVGTTNRPRNSASATFTANWTANQANTAPVASVNVLSLINSLYQFNSFQAGGHVVLFVECTAETGDMNFSVDLAGSYGGTSPSLEITFTYPAQPTEFWDFNLLSNPSFYGTTDSWFCTDVFGSQVVGSIARDTSFTYNGRTTLKFTAPAPSGSMKTNVMTSALAHPSESHIFCGMIYIPSSVTGVVEAGFAYYAGNTNIITARNTWVPFCSEPLTTGTGTTDLYPYVTLSGFTAGQNFWLADCAVYRSSVKQTPFSAWSSKGSSFAVHARHSVAKGTIARVTYPTDYYNDGTALRPRRKFVKGNDGIWNAVGTYDE